MQHSRIRKKLSANSPALCTTLALGIPEVFEMVSKMAFDGIWVDMEHHQFGIETISHLTRAARVGVADIVARPAKGEFMRMARMLEIGAQAIMYPRCDSPEEAADVVQWAKFAPLGRRGYDGANADADYLGMSIPEYIEHANRETVMIMQLESQHAVDQAESIAAVKGVDVIMLGPSDYSILEGFPGEFYHERINAANRQIAIAAKNAGKHWGSVVGTIQQAQESLELGAKLIFQGADIRYVREGFEGLRDEYMNLGFKFGE